MTEKNPDTRHEEHLWSISTSGTLYFATMPGQNRNRTTHIDAPTRVGKVLQVKYTSRWYVKDSSDKVGAFKLQISPQNQPPSANQSPVYAVAKWYVLVENKFDTFEHVQRWQTPQAILDNYEVWTDYPKDSAVKNGTWLKKYFKTAEQKEDSGYQQSRRKRAVVRTTDAASSARRKLADGSSSSSSSSSSPLDVFAGQAGSPAPAKKAVDTMMLSQDPVEPPPAAPGIMICVCWWFI